MSAATMVCFGKVPSRGDFIRSSEQPVLTQTLDRWASQAIELMAQDARWKQVYDTAPALHFAFLGVASPMVLAGHLRPSMDASGRRFPLITASAFEVAEPLRFMASGVRAIAPLWPVFERAAKALHDAADASSALAQIDGHPVEATQNADALEAAHEAFLDTGTLESLSGALAPMSTSGFGTRAAPVDVRRLLLALGLLLRAVPASGAQHLEKGIVLPLPPDPRLQIDVAALWLDLVHRFLSRAAFEIVLFQPSGPAPRLAIGFAGGAPQQLQAMLDPSTTEAAFVDLRDNEWVDDHVDDDYALRKLSSYLEQPRLSLRQMTRTFREAFLGE